MAIDGKYGKVTTEFGTIGEDEPVVVFRAQDRLLPGILLAYKLMCEKAGSPRHHLERIELSHQEVVAWQGKNPIQTPKSEGYAKRMQGS